MVSSIYFHCFFFSLFFLLQGFSWFFHLFSLFLMDFHGLSTDVGAKGSLLGISTVEQAGACVVSSVEPGELT